MTSERRDWEYSDGPTVGPEVPVTSDPREEDAPGVPSRSRGGRSRGEHGTPERRPPGGEVETRAVEVDEPELSPSANARLTEEVRDVVGSDNVDVPRDRPHMSHDRELDRPGMLAYLGTHRPMLLGTLAGALVVGAVIALVTGSWWVLLLALGVHAVATIAVVAVILRMTATIEHPSADLAATLSAEGVRNPDEHFSRLVGEFTPEGQDDVDEQSSSVTPDSGPSRPVGHGDAPPH